LDDECDEKMVCHTPQRVNPKRQEIGTEGKMLAVAGAAGEGCQGGDQGQRKSE
jgi:hypothetical protein